MCDLEGDKVMIRLVSIIAKVHLKRLSASPFRWQRLQYFTSFMFIILGDGGAGRCRTKERRRCLMILQPVLIAM